MKIRHVALLALGLACSAPPPRTTKLQPSASSQPEPPTGPTLDLSPVPAPANVVARGRIENIGASLGVVSSFVGAPRENAEQASRAMLAEFLRRQLRLEVDPGALATEVALAGSIDLIATLPESDRPAVDLAFSIPLTSVEGVKLAAGERLSEVAPGVWKLDSPKARVKCSVMASAGAVSVRLVCGLEEDDVALLGPYLVRTVPTLPPGSKDVDLSLDVGVINAKYGDFARKMGPSLAAVTARNYHVGIPAYDAAIDNVFKLVATEAGQVLGDVRELRLSGTLDADKGVALDLDGQIATAPSSALLKTFTTASRGLPASFGKGPKDAANGVYFTVGDTALTSQLMSAAKTIVESTMAAQKVGSDAEQKKVLAFLDAPFGAGTAVSVFSGATRVTKGKEPKTPAESWQASFDSLFGFYLFGLNVKSADLKKWLDSGVAAFNQPGMQKSVRAAIGPDEQLGFKAGKAPAALGKGASLFELAIGNTKDGSTGKLHVIVGADGEDGSWIGLGFDKDEVAERIRRATAGTDALDKNIVPANSSLGTFITLRSFRSTLLGFALAKPEKGAKPEAVLVSAGRRVDAVFDQLPKKGWDASTLSASAGDGKLGVSLRMSGSAVGDVRALFNAILVRPGPPKSP